MATLDCTLRLLALASTLTAAILMGTSDETLPFFTRFIRFQAKYDDLPAFIYVDDYKYFMVATAIANGYLGFSLPLSVYGIVKPSATGPRGFLLFFDTIMLALLTSTASSTAAIVYLAHRGNPSANWFSICQQFSDFCRRTSGSVVAAFVGVVFFMFLIAVSALIIGKH